MHWKREHFTKNILVLCWLLWLRFDQQCSWKKKYKLQSHAILELCIKVYGNIHTIESNLLLPIGSCLKKGCLPNPTLMAINSPNQKYIYIYIYLWAKYFLHSDPALFPYPYLKAFDTLPGLPRKHNSLLLDNG